METGTNKIDMKRLVLIVLAAVIGSIIGKYIGLVREPGWFPHKSCIFSG